MKPALKNESPNARKAFTLVELLVVVAVLALLAALTLPALAGNKDQIRVAQCTGTLRQFALALHNYGNESNNRLPDMGNTGSWAWDVSRPVLDALMRHGATREQMYDPGFPEQNVNLTWEAGSSAYRVIGYAVTFPGAFVSAANINTSLTPPYAQFGPFRVPAPDASKRVLLACATLCAPKNNPTVQQVFADPSQFNFTRVIGFQSFNGGNGHRSPHLNGTIPAGGNIAALDGHVEWREFKDMTNRVSSGVPNFWW